MELTPEKFEELQNKSSWLEAALREQREKDKGSKQQLEEMQAKLAEYSKKEQDEAEKEAKKKGKYEDLLKEKEEKIKTLEEKANSWEQYTTSKTEKLQTEYEELHNGVSEEIQKDYADILGSLDLEKKVSFLKKMNVKLKVEDFGNPPKKVGETTSWFQLLTVDAFSKLWDGQRKDYFTKSKEVHGEVKFDS